MEAVPFGEVRARVRYKETDQMGIAHHANYLVWFEIGRTDLCERTGMRYRDIELSGVLLVVAEIQCVYRIPYRYDEDVVIRTSIVETSSRSMRFGYELLNGDGTARHATGTTRHLWLDRETRRPVVAPAAVMAAFAPWLPVTAARQ
ncbi:MAG: thioesterase family protein [Acidobacteriota bacterium]